MAGALLEADDLARGREPHAELQCLGHGEVRELGAGDTLREPEVVLDSRARPGLPARRDRLHRERVEPLGHAVDRCRQSRRTRADDDEIEAAVRDRLDRHAEVLRHDAGCGAPDDLATRDDDGQVLDRQAELVDEPVHVGVGVDVEPLVGKSVAGEEFAHRQGLGRVPRPDDPHGARGAFEQQVPAEHERREDRVAHTGNGGDDPAERLRGDLDDLPGLRHAAVR